MSGFLRWLQSVCVWPGRVAGWLILPLIVSVCLTVLAAQLGMNMFVEWGQGGTGFRQGANRQFAA